MKVSALTGKHNYFEDFKVGEVLKHARGKTVEPLEQVWITNVTMNTAAAIVVAFDNTVADPRGPNTVCDPMPPNAPARSAALPLCSSTTTIRNKHTIT